MVKLIRFLDKSLKIIRIFYIKNIYIEIFIKVKHMNE